MSTPATVPARAGTFAREVLDQGRGESLRMTLPAHIKPERFERNLIIAVTQQPKLLNCNPHEVFAEVSKAAALGLYLDPQLGEAYLIVSWNGRERKEVPQLRLGYRGLIKLGRQSGEIAQLYAHEARANDMLRVSLGSSKELVHEPDYLVSEDERGEIVLYYAVVVYKDGSKDFEPMTIRDLEAIRDRSDGWRAYADGKIKSTPWSTDFGEMAKKTVLRRLMKRLPQSPEIADALAVEDTDYREDPTPGPRLSLRSQLTATKSDTGFRPDNVTRALAATIEHDDIVDPEDTLDEALDGDTVPDWGEDAPNEEPAPAPSPEPAAPSLETAWDHIAWSDGVRDQAGMLTRRDEYKVWYGTILASAEYEALHAADPEAADALRSDMIEYHKRLK